MPNSRVRREQQRRPLRPALALQRDPGHLQRVRELPALRARGGERLAGLVPRQPVQPGLDAGLRRLRVPEGELGCLRSKHKY